jgi:hypothetical protein
MEGLSIHNLIDTIAGTYSLPESRIIETIEKLTSDRLSLKLKRQVFTSFDNGELCAWFFCDDSSQVNIDFRKIGGIAKNIAADLPGYLSSVEDMSRYMLWKSRKHAAWEGIVMHAPTTDFSSMNALNLDIILKKNPSMENGFVSVDLGEAVGYLPQRHFSPRDKYSPGDMMKFYILKVHKPCIILLSRTSIELPSALMRDRLPFNEFKTLKRIVGAYSILETDAHHNTPAVRVALKTVSRELGGEVIRLMRGQNDKFRSR